MLISDMAVRHLQWQRDSMTASVGTVLARLMQPLIAPIVRLRRRPVEQRPSPPEPHAIETVEPAPITIAVPTETAADARRWRRHPQLRGRDDSLPSSERHARHAAVRGLFNARSGDYEGARLAFAEAAREDALDLTALPGFWSLPRAGMTAAVLAYEDTGRLRDASALAAHLRTVLRPRALSSLPAAPSQERRQAVSTGD